MILFDIQNLQKASLGARIGWAVGRAIALSLAIFLVSWLIFILLFSLFPEGIDLLSNDAWGMSLYWLVPLIATVFLVFIMRTYLDMEPMSTVGWTLVWWHREFPKGLWWGFSLITAGFLGLWWSDQIAIIGFQLDWNGLLSWAFLFLVAALFEEVLFRGYLQTMFSELLGMRAGLVISALLFSLAHIPNENFSVIGGLNILLAGFMLGLVYLRSRRLWVVTGLHFAWNYFQGVIYGFGVSGMRTYKLLQLELKGSPMVTGGEFGFEGSILSLLILLAFIYWQRDVLQREHHFKKTEIIPEDEFKV